MVILKDKQTGQEVGTISEEQLQFLIDQLEEESDDDTDYYINGQELDVFEEQGADRELVGMLRKALGGRDGFDLQWEII